MTLKTQRIFPTLRKHLNLFPRGHHMSLQTLNSFFMATLTMISLSSFALAEPGDFSGQVYKVQKCSEQNLYSTGLISLKFKISEDVIVVTPTREPGGIGPNMYLAENQYSDQCGHTESHLTLNPNGFYFTWSITNVGCGPRHYKPRTSTSIVSLETSDQGARGVFRNDSVVCEIVRE